MPGNWFIALKVEAGPWWARIPEPPSGVRLLPAEDLHVTVAFLGPVDGAAATAAFELAPRWPAGRMEVRLGDVVPMGNPRRPGALSAVLTDGREQVVQGIEAVRDAMIARAGARPDQRPPLPHVTIARPRRRGSRREFDEARAWAAGVRLGGPRTLLDRLVLYTKAEAGGGRLFREHGVCSTA